MSAHRLERQKYHIVDKQHHQRSESTWRFLIRVMAGRDTVIPWLRGGYNWAKRSIDLHYQEDNEDGMRSEWKRSVDYNEPKYSRVRVSNHHKTRLRLDTDKGTSGYAILQSLINCRHANCDSNHSTTAHTTMRTCPIQQLGLLFTPNNNPLPFLFILLDRVH